MTITLVVAMGRNRVIGRDGGLPWHLPEDLAHFKRVTMGGTMVMGRKTYEAIGRPLPGRRSIVVTRQRDWVAPPGVAVVHSLDDALALAADEPEVFVIGGEQIFGQVLPRADRVELTEVDLAPDGDVHFPQLDRDEWRETARDVRDGLAFVTYERARAAAPRLNDLVDFHALFDAAPSPYLVLDPQLRIVTANRARLQITGRRLQDIVGHYIFEVFPGARDRPEGGAAEPLLASFRRVLDTGLPDTLAVQRYDIPDPVGGGFSRRYWSPVNVPVLDADGRVAFILHRAEDVTEFILAGRADGPGPAGDSPDEQRWRRRVEEAQTELYVRSQELAEVNAQLRESHKREVEIRQRLAALVRIAQRLADVERMEDLTAAVIDEGLAALGVDGGAVGVRDDEEGVVRLVFASLGDAARDRFGELPLDGPLAAAVAARTGERVLLPDRAAGLAWAPEMAEVYETTELEAWASLPLTAGGRVMGSLTVGWREPREFPASELELLEAFAAQCAQAIHRVNRLTAERRDSQISRQMAEALQRSLLTAPPESDHLGVEVRYLPAGEHAKVGGDWFDAFLTPDGATSIVIGDVTGHDQNAVAAMGQIRNILRGVAYTLVEPPAAVLSALDRALRGMAVDALATIVLATIEQTDDDAARGIRRFRWSNAGHLPPLLLRADGQAELLERPSNLLVGVNPAARRDDHEVELRPLDTVLLYTDGLVERRGELLSHSLVRLRSEAAPLADLPLKNLCDSLLERLDPVRDDDIALVAVRPYPEDEPRPAEAGPRTV